MSNDLKAMARSAEKKLAESLLRWKYRKEGKPIPEDDIVERQSDQVTEEARRILRERGKKAWDELKRAYRRGEDTTR